jgi:hypothetical protein
MCKCADANVQMLKPRHKSSLEYVKWTLSKILSTNDFQISKSSNFQIELAHLHICTLKSSCLNFLHHRGIGQRTDVPQILHFALGNFTEDAPHDFSAPGFG